jgi:hypothetical protein
MMLIMIDNIFSVYDITCERRGWDNLSRNLTHRSGQLPVVLSVSLSSGCAPTPSVFRVLGFFTQLPDDQHWKGARPAMCGHF